MALRHQTHPTSESASHRDVLCLTPGREIGSSAMDPRAHLYNASTPCFPQDEGWNPWQHILPGEETMPESLEIHVRVGHDPSVEIDKVQALKPAWRREQESEVEGGSGVSGEGERGQEASPMGADRIPAAELTGGPQDGGEVTQVHLHGGHLGGGVGGQDQVPRGFALLLVAAGDAEVDAAILLQQPLAQRQPDAAAMGQCQREPRPGWASPGLHSRPRCPSPALTRSHRSPAPRAPSLPPARHPCAITAARARSRPAPPLNQSAHGRGAGPVPSVA